MAVTSGYASLVTNVQRYLARSDLADDVPMFIQSWEERFYRNPKNFGYWMETTLAGTIASNVLAVPASLLQLKVAYVSGNPSSRLEQVSLEQIYGTYPRNSYSGIPAWIARDGSNFVFGPEPDSAYTIGGTYWAKPTVLRDYASDAAAHWIIVNAPDLPLYGALLEAESFLKNDARIAVWSEMYSAALKDYRDMMEGRLTVGFEVLG